MKVADLRAKSVSELNQSLVDCHRELAELRIQHGMGQLKQTHRMGYLKRSIARINGLLTEKEMQAEAE